MAERGAKRPDVARRVAWSAAGLCAVLGIAGVVWEPEPDLGVLCGSASFALDIGAKDFAREQLARAERQEPDDPWVNLLAARLAFLDDDLAAGEARLDRVLAVDPNHGEAHLHYGWSAYERGDWDLALSHYEAGGPTLMLTGRVDLIDEYHIRLALLLIGAGRAEEALAIGEELARGGRRPAAALAISAYSRMALGDDTSFGQELGRAYSSDPFEPLFRQDLGPLARAFPWFPAP